MSFEKENDDQLPVWASPVAPQPPPVNREDEPDIADLVIADIVEKKRMGIAKYGVPLRAFNRRSGLVDLYQELLDAAQYVRQELRERDAETRERLNPVFVTATGDFTETGPPMLHMVHVTRHVMQALLQLRDAGVIDIAEDDGQ